MRRGGWDGSERKGEENKEVWGGEGAQIKLVVSEMLCMHGSLHHLPPESPVKISPFAATTTLEAVCGFWTTVETTPFPSLITASGFLPGMIIEITLELQFTPTSPPA